MFLIEEHDMERVWCGCGFHSSLQVQSLRGVVCTGLDFTDSIWVTTAGKELQCIIRITGCWLSDDVIGIEGKVFFDESAFRVVEVEHSINSLSLRFYLNFE